MCCAVNQLHPPTPYMYFCSRLLDAPCKCMHYLPVSPHEQPQVGFRGMEAQFACSGNAYPLDDYSTSSRQRSPSGPKNIAAAVPQRKGCQWCWKCSEGMSPSCAHKPAHDVCVKRSRGERGVLTTGRADMLLQLTNLHANV